MHSNTVGRRAHGKDMCLRSNEYVDSVIGSLERCVPISTQGRWKQRDIFLSLIGMAVERLSVHSLQGMMSKRPCETSMWYHLGKLDMTQLMDVNNQFLFEPALDLLPKGKKYAFAIDATDDPYYGEVTPLNQDYVVGGKRKKSTQRFYRYITLYVMKDGRKLTLAMLPVQRNLSLKHYVEQLLTTIQEIGLDIEVLLLDRGFYCTEILSYLQQLDIPYILPVKQHGEEFKQLLNSGKRSRCVRYTMGGSHGPLDLKIAIAVKYHNGRQGKHGQKHIGFAVHGIDWTPHRIASTYRKRFGIESSYRMRNLVRPRTTTKNPTIRYLFALISMLLKNIWVAIQWRHFPEPRRGPKRIEQDTFRFDYFRLIVWTTITKKLGFRTKIPTTRPGG